MGELLEIPPNVEPDRVGAMTDRTVGSRETWMLAACAVVAPVVVAAALTPWRARLSPADDALILVVVVVAVASSGRRWAAALCALAAALSFDFFLTRPYESLRISRTTDLTTEVLLLVVGLLVGDLAARGRYHRTSARTGRDQLVALHGVTELVAAGAVPEDVERAAAGELERLLALRTCRFSTGEVGVTAHLQPDGQVLIGTVAWSTGDLGLPHRGVDLPVRAGGKVFGHFLLDPVPGVRVDHASLLVAVAIADQVGAALAASQPRYPARA
jgi:K+-sensing histidine kinase KdpD